MRKFFWIWIGMLIGLAACNNEPLTPAPAIEAPLESLHYDDDNQSAPLFPDGTFEGAVRFPSPLTQIYDGGKLEEIHYYIGDLPSSCTIKIYYNSEGNQPDSLIYSSVTTPDLQENSWNIHVIDRDIAIFGQDIWVGVKYSQQNEQRTLGCDPGPATENGDWLLDNNGWQTLRAASTGIDINWNIRAIIRP